MTHTFDEKLTCEGIIVDGCGGGRFFTIQESKLLVYDPQSEMLKVLLENIHMPKSIRKKACVIYIECENEKIEFDLSLLKRTV